MWWRRLYDRLSNPLLAQAILDPVYFDPATPGLRAEWKRASKCSTCDRDDPAATIFNQESRQEFEITGMCQRCQSKTYRSEETVT